ncbi:hypothetical protein V0R37_18650 [Pollutimonas sp. H1-120]|uniref:hypothetical protein n=1 Tax=Pollutimonas sp. H1-120 TaxID=3148824 RepID=UPI003B527EE9
MKQPLTLDQLRTIEERNLKYHDAMTLLREVKRLRAIVVTAARVMPRWGMADDETVEMVEGLSNILDAEPCVTEAEFDRLQAGRDEISQGRNARPRR